MLPLYLLDLQQNLCMLRYARSVSLQPASGGEVSRRMIVYSGRFGVLHDCRRLALGQVLEFEGGRVSPVKGAERAIATLANRATEGYVYPPMCSTWVFDPRSKEPKDRIAGTERPALLWKLDPTHELTLDRCKGQGGARREDAGFILHLLGYLYGTRLQFEEWWVDGRIPFRSTHNVFFTLQTAADFLGSCYDTWRSWDESHQTKATNLLYMHGRAACYEWDWERFAIEYMVTDACWNLASALHHLKGVAHDCRISTLCAKFGIQVDASRIEQIVDLRNDLFHEALWATGQPSMQVCGDALKAADDLRRLNQRIIPALLGYRTPYVRTPWWELGTFQFDAVKC